MALPKKGDFDSYIGEIMKGLDELDSNTWSTSTVTVSGAELDPKVFEELQKTLKKPETYLGELHFDKDSGNIYVMADDTRIPITSLNDFKKMATKKLLKGP